MKKKVSKKINVSFWKTLKKVQDLNWPRPENFLLGFILAFCLFFGLAMWGIGEQIKNEKSAVSKEAPAVDQKLVELLAGSPMENMIPYLSQKDEQVASFLVAIAKKESNWGKFTPKKNGRECYNYWGYRGPEDRTLSGYSCFRNPRQAVFVVGERISKLIDQKIDTPSEMIVWKCGRDCEAAGGQEAAEKWIQDVDYYYRKLYN